MIERRQLIVLALLAIYAAFWAVMAVDVFDRQTWWLENVLVFASLPWLIAGYRRFPLSLVSYVLVFAFFFLHAIGSHFTYSRVPYDPFMNEWFGVTLSQLGGWERNHYDRFVHFAFGALLAYPCREVFIRVAGVRGFWGYLMPVLLLMSLSLMYELIEWWAATVFGGDLGIHYLGTQGDVWDGHRDMALASAGALLAMLATAITHRLILRRRSRSQRRDEATLNDPRL